MGVYELALVIYVLLWLLALVDAAMGRFSHWYDQLIWLLVIFLVPLGSLVYLWFGRRKVARGGINMLRKRQDTFNPGEN